MSIYIHIPFCTRICSYCDFSKLIYKSNWADDYLKSLKQEILDNYNGELIDTLYIGGGTPSSLSINQLKKLFEIIKIFKLNKNCEITLESNSEDLTEEKLKFLKKHINRLSIGVQTFNPEVLKTLNRTLNKNNIINAFKYFENINLDLMYGFKDENIDRLNKDLEEIIKLNPKHISTYSLILEKNTKLYIEKYKPISEDLDRKMYDYIINILNKNGYIHYEISNFAKKGYKSKHNLVYWNNKNYYGFGLGASGYLNNIRYENTRNLNNYLKGKYRLNNHKLDLEETISNEIILNLRKTKGINKKEFRKKYNIDIKEIKEINNLLESKLLKEDKDNIFINEKYLYTSNEILLKFINLSIK